MNLSHVNKYQGKIFKFIDKYQDKIFKFQALYMKIILFPIHILKSSLYWFLSLVSVTGKFVRYTTFPFHWIGIYIYLRKSLKKIDDLPIFKLGAHYIYGKPGSGKSTMIYHAIMDYAYMTGKCSYTTAYMEIPRTNLDGTQYYYHQVFEPSDFYKDGIQISSFDPKFNIVVYEEMLTQYHQRDNKKKSYNDEILPMIGSMGTQRHQGIDLFYFISQLPRNDISIMQMLIGYHEPKIKKGFDYLHWLETGLFRFKIKGWKVTSYEVEISGQYDYKLVNKKRWFYENIYPDDMEHFNRLNMKKQFNALPRMKGATMSA